MQDPNSVLGGVIVEDPAIISNHQILEKLLEKQTKKKRLASVHLTQYMGVREVDMNPSSEDSVVAKNVKMVYDGGIATSECSI